MEKKTGSRTGRILRRICGGLIMLFLLASTLPCIPDKGIGQETNAILSQIEYYAYAPGPDRALLVESVTDALSLRLEMLRSATDTLDIVYHSMHNGPSTDAFLGEVLLAADRGVRVRILVDGKVGFTGAPLKNTVAALALHENISCKAYNPISLLRPWEWHALLHDKFIIVDEKILILGGRNIGDRYFVPDGFAGGVVQDRDVMVSGGGEGSVLSQAGDYMNLLWNADCSVPYRQGKAAKADLEALRGYPSRFLESNPRFAARTLADYLDAALPTNRVSLLANPINPGKKEPVIAAQLARLAAGGEQVLFQTPYATANRKVLAALTALGDKATMLTNTLATTPNFPAFSNYISARKQFVNTGITIYEYQSVDSIHGKSLVVDGRLSAVGSLNLDDRSIYLDTESMLVIDSPEFAASLTGAINSYIDSSLAVGPDNRFIPRDGVSASPVNPVKRVIMFLVSIFSRLFQFLV